MFLTVLSVASKLSAFIHSSGGAFQSVVHKKSLHCDPGPERNVLLHKVFKHFNRLVINNIKIGEQI